MLLKPKLYKTKKYPKGKIELRLYSCGMRINSLADRIPPCFGLINELKRKKVNCRARCSLREFCKKVAIQFKGDLEE